MRGVGENRPATRRPHRMDQNEALLRGVPLLSRLREADLRALAARGREQAHAAGATIVREGDPGDALHIIVEGSVRISVLSPDGDEATMALLGEGECFGELALLDRRPRSASAVATQATRTLVVGRDELVRWLSERPEAALALLETLSLRLRRTNETLGDLAFLDLEQRLAKRLLHMAAAPSRTRATERSAVGVRLRITQEELASMLGVSRESVNKQLALFAQESWVALGRGSVTVLDREALQALM